MPVMTLHNRDWQNGVNVEARQGPYFDCNQNHDLGSRRLQFNEDWVINSGPTTYAIVDRDTDPNIPNGQMTEWIVLSSANGDQIANLG